MQLPLIRGQIFLCLTYMVRDCLNMTHGRSLIDLAGCELGLLKFHSLDYRHYLKCYILNQVHLQCSHLFPILKKKRTARNVAS